ncbi:flavin reductase [Verrucosispora sp. WMMC514]|uniref:flavin reductase n=1 Tax=Verrucosispora sp. WMMC514 TaxID=3015156 RepID=UPI00248B63EE|nr:flavin reductase [Verrucosispora sp. WMMC514]WBB91807.1 flavin reductase [Verrucosispora sp. WMMC514]
MNTPAREHVPSRPTWRCRACGIAWPCSAAKLRLLAEYRGNIPGLMIYLVTLREEAIAQLAERDPGTRLPDLHRRFTDWVPATSARGRP